MVKDWQALTKLTQNEPMVVERVKLSQSGIVIEGEFELPPMARLAMEDQIFIAAFIKTHGSIKQMEKLFGVSYPTIKNRLNRLGREFDFVKVESEPTTTDVLEELERGEISVEEALGRLQS